MGNFFQYDERNPVISTEYSLASNVPNELPAPWVVTDRQTVEGRIRDICGEYPDPNGRYFIVERNVARYPWFESDD